MQTLCKSRADGFNSSPHVNFPSIKGEGTRIRASIKFPLTLSPNSLWFLFSPKSELFWERTWRRHWSRKVSGNGRNPDRRKRKSWRQIRSNDCKRVAFSPPSHLKRLFAHNSVIPKKCSPERWYGAPSIHIASLTYCTLNLPCVQIKKVFWLLIWEKQCSLSIRVLFFPVQHSQ